MDIFCDTGFKHGQPWSTTTNTNITMVNHSQSYLTMDVFCDTRFKHGQPWSTPTDTNLTMVNHNLTMDVFCDTRFKHGQPRSNTTDTYFTMVNHSQSKFDHGRFVTHDLTMVKHDHNKYCSWVF